MLLIQRKEHHVLSTTIQRAEKNSQYSSYNGVVINLSLSICIFICMCKARHSTAQHIFTCVLYTLNTNVNYYILLYISYYFYKQKPKNQNLFQFMSLSKKLVKFPCFHKVNSKKKNLNGYDFE